MLKADIHWTEVGISIVVGLAFGWLFLRRQKAQSSPLVDFNLFRNIRFSLGATAALVAGFSLLGVQYVLSQELQLVRGMSPLQAGLFLLPIAAASFISGPAVGGLMLKVGIERMMAVMLGVGVLGLGLYTVTGHLAPYLWEFTTMAIIGLGAGGSMAVASTAIMISAPEDRAGMAGSIESISYELGGTLGVAVIGSVLATLFTQGFVPPSGITLPQAAWDSLDQTMLAVSGMADGVAQQVLDAGKAAFMVGANATFMLGTVIMAVLFIGVASYAWNKKPTASTVQH